VRTDKLYLVGFMAAGKTSLARALGARLSWRVEDIDELIEARERLTIADIFADKHFWAREMLLEHTDPGFGEYIGPGIVPKFSETPGAVRWSGTWEEGSHNQDVYGGLLGLADEEIAELETEGIL